jgi:3,4-dihydroxy 2-butanone 4-phosphate synthase/GTP cyclohydrolase II
MIAYESEAGIGQAFGGEGESGSESHVALVYGDLERAQAAGEAVLVRVHAHCLAGNLFGSTLCDCRETLESSMRAIAEAGCGAIVYLHHTQRGLGVDASVAPSRLVFHRSGARATGERSEDGQQRVLRQVGLGGQILSDLGIHKIVLLSNHPTHVPALQGFGIEIVGQAALPKKTLQGTRGR